MYSRATLLSTAFSLQNMTTSPAKWSIVTIVTCSLIASEEAWLMHLTSLLSLKVSLLQQCTVLSWRLTTNHTQWKRKGILVVCCYWDVCELYVFLLHTGYTVDSLLSNACNSGNNSSNNSGNNSSNNSGNNSGNILSTGLIVIMGVTILMALVALMALIAIIIVLYKKWWTCRTCLLLRCQARGWGRCTWSDLWCNLSC